MADKKCKKGSRSGAHGDARRAVTTRNKARRAKRLARWLAKRKVANKIKASLKALGKVKSKGRSKFTRPLESDPSVHTILFRNDDGGRSLHEVRIDGCTPEGFTPVSKDESACIHFLTKAGKKWTMRFSEFSFLIPARKIHEADVIVNVLKIAAEQPKPDLVVIS